MHLSFVIERLMLSGDEEEHCADVDEVSRMQMNGSSEEARGNSAILSIRGALTETSGDSTFPSRPTLALYGVGKGLALVDNGRDTLRVDREDFLAGECDTGSCNHKSRSFYESSSTVSTNISPIKLSSIRKTSRCMNLLNHVLS